MATLIATATPAAQAQSGPLPDVTHLSIGAGPVAVDPRLSQMTGRVEVVVQLGDSPLALAGQRGSAARTYARGLDLKHDELMAQVLALGGVEKGRLTRALNAVIVEIDAEQIARVEALANVRSIRLVGEYELDLSETVPYIGAASVQQSGFDGTGVTVAVLDSGIDYTHANLGGAGDDAAYIAAYGSDVVAPITSAEPTVTGGLFPTAKVIGGYDFVGEAWPTYGARSEDPDPIDFEGHGTHVADIIAGEQGVAPGASLYAVKVCSAVASSCNGISLLLGVDYALDPNGDNDLADRVDVINMSLGSAYGQAEDDLSEASANAVRAGAVVVVSAGNSANRPYIVGSPSTTPEVISVAQTAVPSAVTFPLVVNAPAQIAGLYNNTNTVPFAPIGAGFAGDVAAAGLACAALPPGSLAGKVALINRGTCSISLKVDAAADAGAIGVILANNAPGDAPSFSFGGGESFVPTLVVGQEVGATLSGALGAGSGVNVSVSPDVVVPLKGSVVSTSSRGPSISYNQIKPDVGAPGASISAIAGGGTATEAFGGTSGAAPMVSGAVALLLQARPSLTPPEVKALLMNTAETEIFTNPATLPGELAPITRIGGGEVRIDRAVASTTAAWDDDDLAGSLSFGFQGVAQPRSFFKRLRIQNYGDRAQDYRITPAFRYGEDQAGGGVKLEAPSRVRVPAGGFRIITVRLTVDPRRIAIWELDGGALGGDGAALNGPEFDGYLTIASARDTVTVPWHILPQRSADVAREGSSPLRLRNGEGLIKLKNRSVALDGLVENFALTGTSPVLDTPLPQPGENFAIVDLKAVGVRQATADATPVVQFAITTYGRRAHPNYPAEFDVYLDTNRDGTSDYVLYNSELTGFGATGQAVVNVLNLSTGAGGAYFYVDADLNSENVIFTAPLAALGLTADTQFDFAVYAFDNYFTGVLTDNIGDAAPMTHTLGLPKYLTYPIGNILRGQRGEIYVRSEAGGAQASPSQTGILLLLRSSKVSRESIEVVVR